jgi:hypothetical protein
MVLAMGYLQAVEGHHDGRVHDLANNSVRLEKLRLTAVASHHEESYEYRALGKHSTRS